MDDLNFDGFADNGAFDVPGSASGPDYVKPGVFDYMTGALQTGLALGSSGSAEQPPGWEGFAARGLVPDARGLRFIFRAITPPGRTRPRPNL